MFGRKSEISMPLWPRGLNSRQGASNLFFATARRVLKWPKDSGMGWPASLMRSGLGSKRSTWLGPPDMKGKMTRLAFGAKWVGLGVKGFSDASSPCSPSSDVSATMPKPPPARFRKVRRDVVKEPYGPGQVFTALIDIHEIVQVEQRAAKF